MIASLNHVYCEQELDFYQCFSFHKLILKKIMFFEQKITKIQVFFKVVKIKILIVFKFFFCHLELY